MNNCLVTKLKATVNNEALSKLNVLTIKTKATDSPTQVVQWIVFGTSENGSVSINSSSVGLYQSGISGELWPYPYNVPANSRIESHFENKDGIIEVTGKYNLNEIILGNNGTVRIKEIYGIPGTINRLIIRNVEEGEIDAAKLKNALDIGTGSAILAIAANLLYNIPVVAFDNDAMAILNATENIRLNSCSDNISLFCGEISDVNGKFDLILANIYAEILLDIHENILNSCTKNTFLLLSGIQEIKSDKIISKYSENFNIIAKLSENGWTTILLKIK